MTSLVAALGLGLGCGPAPDTKQPVASASAAQSGAAFDPCKNSPPPPGVYHEILKDLKCDQELYLRMSAVAADLGVDCGYCHVPIPGPKKDFDFPKMTERKQIALFMNHEFIDGLKQKDGEKMRCRSCHLDKNGKPAAKFLGEPRDTQYALEWMNLVMVNKFTKLDGSKLKCKDCHVGNIGTSEFRTSVILHADQINLPSVTPFERYPEAEAQPPTPTATPSASAGPPPTAPASASAKPPASASATARPPSSAKPPIPNPASSDPNLFPPGKH
ncbi:MAG: hypothetical protein U0414_15475 [Polyangiaceae bacterium]